MSTFELYLHGTPNGHQIWGSQKNHDYISTFYNHDSGITDKSVLQIDICLGDSYYTYIHQQDVYDSNERPGSFFAMTVSFPKSYCTNVYKLYQIFEVVYGQICVGSLIAQKQNKEIFLVSDFEASRSGNIATVDKIRAIFIKNIGELIEPYISPLGNVPDTFNKAKKQYSLKEVDSPLFFDFFKKQSVIVSPNLEPAAIANQAITKQLNSAISQKEALESANTQLQEDNSQLLKENKNLSDQLYSSVSSSEKKYSATINQLRSELKAATQERDELQAKIDEAKSSVELIDKPIQKLTHLLVGRFPENGKNRLEKDKETARKSPSKNSNKIWNSGLNSVLLGVIIVLCVAILYFVASGSIGMRSNAEKDYKDQLVDTISAYLPGYNALYSYDKPTCDSNEKYDSAGGDVNKPTYDKWNECIINIKNGGDELTEGKTYTLVVTTKNGSKANVPDGRWVVEIEKGNPINTEDSFSIPTGTAKDTNVRIQYIVDNQTVMTRTPKVN